MTVSKPRLPGVTWVSCYRCWEAHIPIKGKRYFLGYFSSQVEAHEAYVKAKRDFSGQIYDQKSQLPDVFFGRSAASAKLMTKATGLK